MPTRSGRVAMAVAHRLGSSLRFNFDGAAETPAFMCNNCVVAPTMLLVPSAPSDGRFKRSAHERNDRASALLDMTSGIREGLSEWTTALLTAHAPSQAKPNGC